MTTCCLGVYMFVNSLLPSRNMTMRRELRASCSHMVSSTLELYKSLAKGGAEFLDPTSR